MKFREIKEHARESLKGNWFVAIIASFVAGTFGAIGGGTSASASNSQDVDFSALSQFTTEEILTTVLVFGGIAIFGLIISVFLTSLISVGYSQFNLDLIDGVKPSIATMFSKGKQVGTAICANILIFIRVFFGTILFVIPGIIASYKYAMVNYIIAENPGITATEALEMSKEMMKGNKLRFFFFGLSFLGWALVVVLTFGIASLWVAPYMQASFAKFYREIA